MADNKTPKQEKITTVRGFRDLYGDDAFVFSYIEKVFKQVAYEFGFKEIVLPVLEKTQLFKRGVGETTDIVEKEMFSFVDGETDSKDGVMVSLRPEGTASTVRSYIENGLRRLSQYNKLFYYAPMFRRERPQKGRYRQFYQFGVEVFDASEAYVDAEVIALLYTAVCTRMGIKATININSVGCGKDDCRPNYKRKLQEFFGAHKDELCEDCKRRLDTNPLRLLDCKNERCVDKTNVPKIYDYLCEECSTHYKELKKFLGLYGTEYKENYRIVRGLDYYVRTAFEFVLDNDNGVGSASVIAGGGRYDGLVRQLGGEDVSGIGFAVGVDRLALAILEEPKLLAQIKNDNRLSCYIVALGLNEHSDAEHKAVIELVAGLRRAGKSCEVVYGGKNISKFFDKANKLEAQYTLILGESEFANKTVSIKNMTVGEQATVAISDLLANVSQHIN